ncbi:hypothetical protein [Sutterella wadsworthensis]|uniref:hypothetical protein n=1 Tax=Sutterella wadsworthensis TaxID=40545 RepID=UPI0039672509
MRSWSYHLLALFVVLCWGMTLVSSKVLLNFGMQPWALVELRSVLAYGILIFLAPMQLYSGTMRGEITVALLGLTSIPLFFRPADAGIGTRSRFDNSQSYRHGAASERPLGHGCAAHLETSLDDLSGDLHGSNRYVSALL